MQLHTDLHRYLCNHGRVGRFVLLVFSKIKNTNKNATTKTLSSASTHLTKLVSVRS